ncbi:cohesin subunit SA-1-like, partial [Acropora millepora]|uniref:cohesin subunit SA-1-like n=1 Tax=Acropora millepora TaxID=45264 RepID=UPI001CF44557
GQSGKDQTSEDSDLEVPVLAPTPGRGRKRAAGIFKATPAAKKAKSKPFSLTPKISRKKDRKTGEDTGQGSLFDIVKAGKGALRAVVDDWIESYTSDKETGMVDLIQFFVQCCCCKGSKFVTQSVYLYVSMAVCVEDSHEYPLIMTGPAYKKFR